MIYKPDMTLLKLCQDMSLSLRFLKRVARACSLLLHWQWKRGIAGLVLTIPALAFGQNYARQAGQFSASGSLPGDHQRYRLGWPNSCPRWIDH